MDMFSKILGGITSGSTKRVTPVGGGPGASKQFKKFTLTPDLIKELSSSSPLVLRLKAMKEYCEVMLNRRLEDNGVEVAWECIKDLIDVQLSAEDRQLFFKFTQSIIKGQYDQLGVMRAHFFRVIKNLTSYDDLQFRLELFQALTSSGKELEYLEEETGSFLVEFMPDIISASNSCLCGAAGSAACASMRTDFLTLINNIIKFNARYLDEDVISGIIYNSCLMTSLVATDDEIKLCLTVFDSVLSFYYLPSTSMTHFLTCLCQLVNRNDRVAQHTWNVMKNLLGTHLGHCAVCMLCCLIQDKSNATTPGSYVVRGAVFFIGMALWGSKRIATLKYPHSVVLPAFLQGLVQSNSMVVTHEILLTVQRLVSQYSEELVPITWDLILDIVEIALRRMETTSSGSVIVTSQISPSPLTTAVTDDVRDLLTIIEGLYERNVFYGSADRLFSIVESCAAKRPENSVLLLIEYRAKLLIPSEDNWMLKLSFLIDRFFSLESRTIIRLKVLDILAAVIVSNSELYQDELIEMVVLPQLSQVYEDPDAKVRQRAIQLLVDQAAACSTEKFVDFLAVFEKVLTYSVAQQTVLPPLTISSLSQQATSVPGNIDLTLSDRIQQKVLSHINVEDMAITVTGLINIFKIKLYHLPSSHAVSVYTLLVNHVTYLMSHRQLVSSTRLLRKELRLKSTSLLDVQILQCLLDFRADHRYRIGIAGGKEGPIAYSPYILCKQRSIIESGLGGVAPNISGQFSAVSSRRSSVTSSGVGTVLSYEEAFRLYCFCMEQELEWSVLELMMERLPHLLKNKILLSTVNGEDIQRLTMHLCKMLGDRRLPEQLQGTRQPFSKSEFHACIFPVLTCLISFHFLLSKDGQMELVRCLEFGLISKYCSRVCVRALTVCALEMSTAMTRQLPSVLLKLSQICATNAMAIPLMEFLSSLIHLPQLYSNFVEEQYKSVFAIALPYTNPYKYNHYTVSLAYNVIAMWFIKCRLPFRQGFVRYIVKGLRANVLRQIEDSDRINKRTGIAQELSRAQSSLNQDSATRTRAQTTSHVEAMKNDKPTVEDGRHAVAAASRHQESKEAASPSSTASVGAGGGSTITTSIAAVPDLEVASNFHKELMETCIDMLTRYRYLTSASIPKRSQVAEFLLAGGQSASWLVGHSVITVTTSGGSKVGRSGLCDKCTSVARAAVRRISFPPPTASSMWGDQDDEDSFNRRRHKSEYRITAKHDDIIPLVPLHSQDDINIQPRRRVRGALQNRLNESCSIEPFEQSETASHRLSGGNMGDGGLIGGDEGAEKGALESSLDRIQAMDNVLMALKAAPQERSIFSPNMCNCWCTQWGEVHIRRPTGNFSWILRIQNGQNPAEMFPEFHLSDISNLFLSPNLVSDTAVKEEKDGSDTGSERGDWKTGGEMMKRIDSAALNEREYATMMDEYFVSASDGNKGELDVFDCEATSENPDVRRTHSSPEFLIDVERPIIADSVPCVDSSGKEGFTESIEENKKTEDSTKVVASLDTHEQCEALSSGLVSAMPSASDAVAPVMRKIGGGPNATPAAGGSLTGEPVSGTTAKRMSEGGRPRSGVLSSVSEESDVIGLNAHESDKIKKSEATTTNLSAIGGLKDSASFQGGVNPKFLFLQLFYDKCLGKDEERPILIPSSESCETVRSLDVMFPYETHKIGVIYVKPGQTRNEKMILSNMYGSVRYMSFIQSLGQLLRLTDCDPMSTYLGGLDSRGSDGQFAYTWHVEFMQVIFHVVTLMPFKEDDEQFTEKKKHIGNDYVTIVYDDSGEEYRMGTIKSQFNYVNIIIKPLDHCSNEITVQTKPEIEEMIGHTDTKIISDTNLALLVRQMASHADLAAQIHVRQRLSPLHPFASNWLERLRRIKQMRERIIAENKKKLDTQKGGCVPLDDFSDFIQ